MRHSQRGLTMTRSLGCLYFMLLMLPVSCSTPAEPQDSGEEAVPSDAGAPLNTLTEAEKDAGWTMLFDGKSLDQWRGFRSETVPPGWEVKDGVLVFLAEHREEGYGDLTTREEFADFELSLEWKIAPCGNSGVMFRVSEDSDQEWHSGPEAQIVDGTEGCWSDYQAPEGERAPGSDLKATQMSGANYDLHPPGEAKAKPVGEWNHMRLLVDGPHVEHWLNGVKAVEYELWSDEWNEMVANSKFVDYPQYGMNKSGHIVLQDHGQNVWFRNIKVRRL